MALNHRMWISDMESISQNLNSSKRILPGSHRFFYDCLRENNARFIQWSLNKSDSAWFVSMTFKTYISPAMAWIYLRRFLSHLHQGLFDSTGRNKGGRQLYWICATEWQVRMVIHFHVLAMGNGINVLSRKRWESRWESLGRNTGFCRIYDADKKAAPYLAKYTSKNLGGEFRWGGDWRGMKVPGSVSCGHANGVSLLG